MKEEVGESSKVPMFDRIRSQLKKFWILHIYYTVKNRKARAAGLPTFLLVVPLHYLNESRSPVFYV